MTKTQAKSRLKKLYESGVLGKLYGAVCEAVDEIADLKNEVEETRDSIEAYEGKDDLTEQQQERYDWFDDLCSDLFDDLCSNLEELADNLDTIQSDLNDFEERLAERE